MGYMLDYFRSITDKTIEFMQEYCTLQYDVQNDIIAISNRIDNISKKKTLTEIFPEIHKTKNYIFDSINKISDRIKSISNIFRQEKPLETIVKTYQPNYTSRINYLSNYSSLSTKPIAEILTGNKFWKWTDRFSQFEALINTLEYSSEDQNHWQSINCALDSNVYLRKKHIEIYNNLKNRITYFTGDNQNFLTEHIRKSGVL